MSYLQVRSLASYAANKLSSLLERNESPRVEPSNQSLPPSPVAPPNTIIRTPETAARIQPPLEEMHPSKVQQSTAKQPDSGLRLGFTDVNDPVASSPSKRTMRAIHSATPTKATPDFDFKWSRPESILSPEAQKIMESVREDAARIKAKMQEDKAEQARRDGETDQLFGAGGRKIAKAKGKAGRYSDIHMEEFKKMDSIAGHVSTWKNKYQGNMQPHLKRSKSKAGFDEPEQTHSHSNTKAHTKPGFGPQDHDRIENTASAKRTKQFYRDDTSAARPVSQDGDSEIKSRAAALGLPRSKSGMPSVMTTPTKASLARAASIKQAQPSKIPSLGHSKSTKDLAHSSKIPSLSRSKSTKDFTDAAGSKTEANNKHVSSLSRFGSMRSILHKPQPKFSDDPVKVAAGTHIPTPKGKVNLEKELPSLPGTPIAGLCRSPSMKRVAFTPNTKLKYDLAAASPSPSKIPAPHLQHQISTHPMSPDQVAYPLLAQAAPLPSYTTQAGDFTFRSTKTIECGPATSGLRSPTIRQVRPSGVSTPLAGFENLPTIPHGMPNKKRRRPEHDEEDIENLEPGVDLDNEEGPRAKRQKNNTAPGRVQTDDGKKAAFASGSQIARPGNARDRGKGKLSLSRLNMLARPKDRR